MILNQLYTLQAPQGMISPEGVRSIMTFMRMQRLREGEWQKMNPNNHLYTALPDLPDTWEWQWVVTAGEFRGRFPRRVSQFLAKLGLRAPQSFLEELGNRARAHTEDAFTYRYKFVDSFNWRAGAFGDNGSCFWGSHSGARQMLEENKARAICFFHEDGTGYARAWIAQIKEGYIVFNGYGIPGNATRSAARVVAQHFELAYHKIRLRNQGKDTGTLWINGGIGYMIGESSVIEPFTSYDLEWEDKELYPCESCGDALHEDEAHWGLDDCPYCERCFFEIFDYCEWCGEVEYRDDMTFIDHEGYCEYCTDRHFAPCEQCWNYFPPAELTYPKDSEARYCDNCLPEQQG